MKTYKTDSDCGAIMLGTKEFGALYLNAEGDGETTVTVYGMNENADIDAYDFVGAVEGCFNLYSYDCCHNRYEEDILATFKGRYGIYRQHMNVVLVQWE